MSEIDTKNALLDAALPHVSFDGWSDITFQAAIEDADVDATVARALCPRGAVDLAVAFHKRGDAALAARMAQGGLEPLRYSERVAQAVRWRLENTSDKEAVRRGTTLFALPQYAADGAKLIWNTADTIWVGLGDTSVDYNWYTKRATLSGVYGATVLYWLGDETPQHHATWDFLERRIADVMQIEEVKARVRKAPGIGPMVTAGERMLSFIKAPSEQKTDMPGRWRMP